jgi:hypothetical protein
MTRRLRLTLVLIGLIILGFSLAALAFALWPGEALREAAPLAPTLFAPP